MLVTGFLNYSHYASKDIFSNITEYYQNKNKKEYANYVTCEHGNL